MEVNIKVKKVTDRMNIGILAYRQYPYISANTDIGYKIGEYIKKEYRHEIVYIGWKQDKCQDNIKEYNGIKVRFLNTKHSKKKTRIQNKICNILGDKVYYLPYAYSLKKIVQREKIDSLICIIAPNINASIAFALNLKIPVFIYQLDPFYDFMDQENSRLKSYFIKMLPKAKHIFTTDILLRNYCRDEEIMPYMDKISAVQFPKLENKIIINTTKNNDENISLLYAGSLYDSIRSPQILIELKKCLPEDYSVVFCGSCDSVDGQKRLEESGIICKGYCSQMELNKEINNATALVNIGNLVKNQMGSKIIDYIATGKPIINIFQIEKCPTLEVLDKYKLKYNIHVNELSEKCRKVELEEFLKNSLDKKLEFDYIEKLYFKYTPKFVIGEIISKIEV